MPHPKHTVFYAWQSDTPGPVGRTFIEKALNKALERLRDDSTVEPADRPEAEVDRDTRGVAGSPPIAATILAKVDRCSVFVGDLTFVGQSIDGVREGDTRFFPNPNVQLEYGYALKARGNERIVAVMNTAYGPSEPLAHLPFDMKHLRAPIFYSLRADAAPPARARVLEDLAKQLAERLGPCLKVARSEDTNAAPPGFVRTSIADPVEYFASVAQFLPPQRFPWDEQDVQFVLKKKSSVYLRLAPVSAVAALDSESAAVRLMEKGLLRPMGMELTGFNHIRNGLGALAFCPSGTEVYSFTQLFLSCELMGVDLKLTHSMPVGGRSGAVSIDALERSCLNALIAFARFYQTSLPISFPWQLECGLSGVYDHCLSFENRGLGRVLKGGISKSATIVDLVSPVEILRPFFNNVWDAAGVERPLDRDALLSRVASHYQAALG